MALEGIVNQRGNLFDSFQELDSATIQHSDEIMKDRQDDEDLRGKWFYTADHALYRVEDDEAVLYLGRGDTNPIFKNIKEATEQLINEGNYILEKEDIEAVVNAESTLKVKISDLELEGDGEYGYFEIDTKNYDKLNDSQRAFAERVYGEGKDFEESMKMLKKADISITRIHVLNSDYVKYNAKEGSVLIWACKIDLFDGDSCFYAYNRGVLNGNWLRGVPRIAEGDAKDFGPSEIMNYLSQNPIKDEKFAAGLLKSANEFYQNRIKE
jgi:hypothetical protein